MKHLKLVKTVPFLLSTFLFHSSAMADEAGVSAFDNYKNCLKAEMAENSKLNGNNFQKYCKKELNETVRLTGADKKRLLKSTKKWIKSVKNA